MTTEHKSQEEVQLLSTKAVARIMGVSPRSIHRFNASQEIIKPLRISGTVRYRKAELTAWIKAGMPDRTKWEQLKGGEDNE